MRGRLGLDVVAGDRVRKGATTKVRCIDVAALIAAAMLRKNDAEVLPFEQHGGVAASSILATA